MKLKKCQTCREIKEDYEFNKNKSQKDGLHQACRKCNSVSAKAYADKNKEKISKRSATRYVLKKEEIDKRNALWRKSNPEAHRSHQSKRRVMMLGVGGTYTKEDIQLLLALQSGKCACCAESIKKRYEIDHISPISKGGSNYKENLQLLCPPCNKKKNAKDPIAFMQSRGFLL